MSLTGGRCADCLAPVNGGPASIFTTATSGRSDCGGFTAMRRGGEESGRPRDTAQSPGPKSRPRSSYPLEHGWLPERGASMAASLSTR